MHRRADRIRVVDVPADASAEQAESKLNEPYAEGFYLEKLVCLKDGAMRAFYKLRVKN